MDELFKNQLEFWMTISKSFFEFMLYNSQEKGTGWLEKLAMLTPDKPFSGNYVLKHFIEQDIMKGWETPEELEIYETLKACIAQDEEEERARTQSGNS